jgi:hypothetical protein
MDAVCVSVRAGKTDPGVGGVDSLESCLDSLSD